MKGRRKSAPPLHSDPMKITWTTDSVSSLQKQDQVQTPSHVFTLTEYEIEQKAFQLRYHTCKDAYYRLGSDAAVIEGWEKGIYAAVNIDRHVDDGLAYLTRTAGQCQASISWKVDLTGSGLVVDSIQALTLSRTLHGGIVTYDIVSPDAGLDSGYVINGWQTLHLIAYLSGSQSEDSYEQTQLLYQDSLDEENYPLDILITLKPLQEILCTCTQDSGFVHKSGRPVTEEVHCPVIEKCACYFPKNVASSSQRQRTSMVTRVTDISQNPERLSVVDRHAISLPGTPIHRKHYGGRTRSAGSVGHSQSLKLNKRIRVRSSECVGYDNWGAEPSIRTHATRGRTLPDQSELCVLEAGDLEELRDAQRPRSADSRRAWPERKQRDVEALVSEESTDKSQGFCSGSKCVIS